VKADPKFRMTEHCSYIQDRNIRDKLFAAAPRDRNLWRFMRRARPVGNKGVIARRTPSQREELPPKPQMDAMAHLQSVGRTLWGVWRHDLPGRFDVSCARCQADAAVSV